MWSFEAVEGVFAPSGTRAVERLGLLDDGKDRWTALFARVDRLNAKGAARGERYKIVLMTRHGQSVHNLYELALDQKRDVWTFFKENEQTGEREQVGRDQPLTAIGQCQALDNAARWQVELAAGLPASRLSIYVSATQRSLQTLELTFEIPLLHRHRPLVVESLRECINCFAEKEFEPVDWPSEVAQVETSKVSVPAAARGSVSSYVRRWPYIRLEPGLTEEDEIWTPDFRETPAMVRERVQELFERIFDEDKSDCIVTFSHGGILMAFAQLVQPDKPVYLPSTAAIVPYLIKGTRKDADGRSVD